MKTIQFNEDVNALFDPVKEIFKVLQKYNTMILTKSP